MAELSMARLFAAVSPRIGIPVASIPIRIDSRRMGPPALSNTEYAASAMAFSLPPRGIGSVVASSEAMFSSNSSSMAAIFLLCHSLNSFSSFRTDAGNIFCTSRNSSKPRPFGLYFTTENCQPLTTLSLVTYWIASGGSGDCTRDGGMSTVPPVLSRAHYFSGIPPRIDAGGVKLRGRATTHPRSVRLYTCGAIHSARGDPIVHRNRTPVHILSPGQGKMRVAVEAILAVLFALVVCDTTLLLVSALGSVSTDRILQDWPVVVLFVVPGTALAFAAIRGVTQGEAPDQGSDSPSCYHYIDPVQNGPGHVP